MYIYVYIYIYHFLTKTAFHYLDIPYDKVHVLNTDGRRRPGGVFAQVRPLGNRYFFFYAAGFCDVGFGVYALRTRVDGIGVDVLSGLGLGIRLGLFARLSGPFAI